MFGCRQVYLLLIALLTFTVHTAEGRGNVAISTDTVRLRVSFREGADILDLAYGNNKKSVENFISTLQGIMDDTSNNVSDIEITTSASPEGSTAINNRLCRQRGAAPVDNAEPAAVHVAETTAANVKKQDASDKNSQSTSSVYMSSAALALKTNILYDAATALNVEVEIPLSRSTSLDLEYVNPWWSMGKGYTLKLLEGSIEGRRWLGNRANRQRLTGWFAGVFAGAGMYDLEYKSSGADGKYFFMGGFSGGYAHRIGKHLGFEYCLGVGYLFTKYNKYNRVYGTQYGDIKVVPEPWDEMSKSWIGPLKAKVLLIWYLDSKKKGGKH